MQGVDGQGGSDPAAAGAASAAQAQPSKRLRKLPRGHPMLAAFAEMLDVKPKDIVLPPLLHEVGHACGAGGWGA